MADTIDWNALAAQVMANYLATGSWYLPDTSSSVTPPASTPTSTTIGSGSKSLTLRMSEDYYLADAQYTISVDGVQIGGVLTAHALHSSGQYDTITVLGDWAAGNHTVTVNFLNDAWAGTASTDRNLYIDAASYGGTALADAPHSLMSAGPASFSFTDNTPPPTNTPYTATIGSGTDSLVLSVSQDAYQGNAQYTITVDGVQIGGVMTAHALHGSGQHDQITVLGEWSAGTHYATINFLNDAYGGSATTDRNLYLDSASYDGVMVPGASIDMLSSGGKTFGFTEPGAPQPPPPGGGVIAPLGYSTVMTDDFSHGYDQAHWGDPFPLPWADGPSSNGAYIWDHKAVQVNNGEMQIVTSLQADGWHSGGFNSFKAGVGITYGKVEFDARVEAAQGVTAAFLMWPLNDTWPPEIDILETPKGQAMHVLHYGSTSADASIQMGGPDPSAWHHYELTWLPNLVEIKTDGQTVASWNWGSPNVAMGFGVMGFVGSQWDSWMGGAPDATTPHTVITHMDNFAMYQWNGIA